MHAYILELTRVNKIWSNLTLVLVGRGKHIVQQLSSQLEIYYQSGNMADILNKLSIYLTSVKNKFCRANKYVQIQEIVDRQRLNILRKSFSDA